MKYTKLQLLEKLSLLFGPSGCEGEVRELIKEQIGHYADSEYSDFMGNYIVRINGKTDKKMMIAAHMDEVGFMISHIDEGGYLYFQPVGGFDPKVLCGRKVTVFGKGKEKLCGLIASKAIHQQSPEERKTPTPVNKMYIDIGAKDKEDAEKYVEIGDFATFDSEFIQFGNGMIKGKAIDDRLGCAIMCDIIRHIRENGITPDFTLYFCFTTREEISRSGANLAVNYVKPDMALTLESTAIADIFGTPPHKKAGKLGSGPCISLMDNGTVYLKEAVEFALETAKRHGDTCQLKKYVSGGTDAAHIHKAVGGVITVNMACPTRYIHSASCVIDGKDFGYMYELALHIALADVNDSPVCKKGI